VNLPKKHCCCVPGLVTDVVVRVPVLIIVRLWWLLMNFHPWQHKVESAHGSSLSSASQRHDVGWKLGHSLIHVVGCTSGCVVFAVSSRGRKSVICLLAQALLPGGKSLANCIAIFWASLADRLTGRVKSTLRHRTGEVYRYVGSLASTLASSFSRWRVDQVTTFQFVAVNCMSRSPMTSSPSWSMQHRLECCDMLATGTPLLVPSIPAHEGSGPPG
jgi:hypothetical protein